MDSLDLFMIVVFYIPLTIFGLSLLALTVSRIMNKTKVANVFVCILWWMTLPFIMPGKAKKLGVLSKKLYGWLLVLVSPLALAIYAILYFYITINSPLPYDRLLFTSHDEIAAITEIPDFPHFDYQSNTHDDWDGTTCTTNMFTDEKEADRLMDKLDAIVQSEDNVYWHKDSLHSDKEKKFYGSDVIYTCDRGWDSMYVKKPKGIDVECQVTIHIGKKRFTLTFSQCYVGGIEYYAVPDSINKLTGVKFPHFEFVNCNYHNMFVDYEWRATLKLDKKPSKQFIEAIKKADNWSELKDGTYQFHTDDGHGMWKEIDIDPNSRYIKLSHCSY